MAPLVVEAIEDGVDDAIDALDVDKADHGPGAAADLYEAALDDIGGAQLSPQDERTGLEPNPQDGREHTRLPAAAASDVFPGRSRLCTGNERCAVEDDTAMA